MAATYKMLPMAQVIDTFSKMQDGEAQLEKAYPGLMTNKMGYMAHVRVDPTTGAWMLKVPQNIQDELDTHRVVQASKITSQQLHGDNSMPLASGAQAAPAQAANQKMTKQQMQASLKTPENLPDDASVGQADPRMAQSRPAPSVDTTKGQPDVSMGASPITPFLASVVPTPGAK